jgi:hypothetical protein
MDSLDLNIDNYDLNDLLRLFNLSINFSEEELKNAKKIVLKTHPDKSGLDKKYFLFFSQAYKNIYKVYQFKKGSGTKSTDYFKDDMWEKENSLILENKIKEMNAKQYNKWFNEMFEKQINQIDDEENKTGYGDWLKENSEVKKANNMQEMSELINQKKQDLRQLIVHKDIDSYSASSGYGLLNKKVEDYSSSMFDKLQFEDLKKAHEESVIPVTQEDYIKKKKYNNIDEITRDRFISENELKTMFKDHDSKIKESKNNDESITAAYNLMKQDEKNRIIYNKFWSDMKKINNK